VGALNVVVELCVVGALGEVDVLGGPASKRFDVAGELVDDLFRRRGAVVGDPVAPLPRVVDALEQLRLLA
jgi:hypothetical protein